MVFSPAELTKEAKAEDLIVYYTKQKLWHLVLELLACSLNFPSFRRVVQRVEPSLDLMFTHL